MQREHGKDHETKSRPIVNISDITHIRLRRRIQKIYDMLTHVIEGYVTFHYKNMAICYHRKCRQDNVSITIGLSAAALKLG